MAGKNILRIIKIELPAGSAGPAEVGKMLGPYGVDLREIMQRYNEATAAQRGEIVPVEVTVFEDRTFALRLLTPPTSFLLGRAPGVERAPRRRATTALSSPAPPAAWVSRSPWRGTQGAALIRRRAAPASAAPARRAP